MKRFNAYNSPAVKQTANGLNLYISAIIKTAIFAVLLSCAASAGFTQEAGDLMVLPTRVVFDGKTRSAELMLINIGKKTATYRISFVHLRMDEHGAFETVVTPQPGEQFVDDMVRFTPRQIILKPRVSQTVRLQLRKPAELPTGEYRSHLQFRAVDNESSTVEDQTPTEGLDIRLKPIYGVSIAVIVRQGETSATATASELELQPATADSPQPKLVARINREGNRSIYGDIEVSFSPKKGKPQLIGKLNGVAVYTPNASRVISVPLQLPDGVVLEKGQLVMAYKQRQDEGSATLASGTLELP